MYTNPSNICKTMVSLLEQNNHRINQTLGVYHTDDKLTVLEGKRNVLPAQAFPCLEIEPQSGSNRWATTRAQRPRYSFNCTVTVKNDREEYAVEYISTVTTVIVEILTSPENLQLRVLNESKWDHTTGLWDTYILDSLVEDVTYASAKGGTIRTAEFSWFAEIHEPYPDSKFSLGESSTPTVIRPLVEIP